MELLEEIKNLAIPLATGLIGVLAGHRLALTIHRERVRSLQTALYKELEILRDDFSEWLPELVSEYDTPLRGSYSGPAPLDLKLTFALVIELAGTDKMITPDQRMLLSRMERMIDGVRKKDSSRDAYIKQWLEHSAESTPEEQRNISASMRFWTTQLLVDSSRGIYYLNKFLNEKSSFFIGERVSDLSLMESAFSFCDVEFSYDKWHSAIQKLDVEPD